jgi:hypothetical protein
MAQYNVIIEPYNPPFKLLANDGGYAELSGNTLYIGLSPSAATPDTLALILALLACKEEIGNPFQGETGLVEIGLDGGLKNPVPFPMTLRTELMISAQGILDANFKDLEDVAHCVSEKQSDSFDFDPPKQLSIPPRKPVKTPKLK